MYDFAKKNGFIVGTERMVDDGGHQVAQIEYPGLPREARDGDGAQVLRTNTTSVRRAVFRMYASRV